MAIQDDGNPIEPAARRDPVHVKHEELFSRYKLDFVAYVLCADVFAYIVSSLGNETDPMFVLDVNHLGSLIENYQKASKDNDQFGIRDYIFQMRHHVARMKVLYKIPSKS